MANPTKVEEGGFAEDRNMGPERQGVNKDDTQVSGGQGGWDVSITNHDGGMWGGGLDVLRVEKKEFGFIVIQYEGIQWHPVTYIGNTYLKIVQGLLLCFRAAGYHWRRDDIQCRGNG